MKNHCRRIALFALTVCLASPCLAMVAEAHVAVAANFTEAAKEIGIAFEDKTGDNALLSFGSSG
ncbi:hypothetical protein [Lichenihabitans psoromatis]|uniref:hypothetical protein n=1 Tax=Lichenihabitans psoromatis TaxID=2528642 RepID=UPI0010384EFA